MGNKTDQGVDLSLRQFIKSLGGIAGGQLYYLLYRGLRHVRLKNSRRYVDIRPVSH